MRDVREKEKRERTENETEKRKKKRRGKQERKKEKKNRKTEQQQVNPYELIGYRNNHRRMTRVVPMMRSWIQKGEDGPRYEEETCPMIAQCSLALNHYSLLAEAQPIQLQSRVGQERTK